MGYDDEAKQMMVRLQEKLTPGFCDVAADEFAGLGSEALKLLFRFPEVLVYAGLRKWVCEVARRMPREQSVPILLDGLSHPDWRIFEISRDVLSGMGQDVRDELVAQLSDCEVPGGRLHALWCLERLADPLLSPGSADASIVLHIARAARKDSSEEIRAAAVVALSRCGGEEIEETIVAALEDGGAGVRAEAARGAGRLRLVAAVPRLLAMLEHPDAEVRADVVYALDRIGDLSATDAVASRLGDEDWYVRWASAKALERLWTPGIAAQVEMATRDSHPLVAAAAADTLAARGENVETL